MLVVSRKKGEKVHVQTPKGEFITVYVTEIGKKAVKIGFDAPKDYTIAREELLKLVP